MKNYEPQSVSEIVFSDTYAQQLIDDIVSGCRSFPMGGKNGILLYGPPGTGKSSLAAILPDAIESVKSGNPSDAMFVSLSQSSNGVALIANISNSASLVSIGCWHHYYVLDEVDNLTSQAMLQLKSVMNIPNTVFVMTTNNIKEIEAGVQSRCHCIEMGVAASTKWLPLARQMLSDAGILEVPDTQLLRAIDMCGGDAREIISAIQEIIIIKSRKIIAISKSLIQAP